MELSKDRRWSKAVKSRETSGRSYIMLSNNDTFGLHSLILFPMSVPSGWTRPWSSSWRSSVPSQCLSWAGPQSNKACPYFTSPLRVPPGLPAVPCSPLPRGVTPGHPSMTWRRARFWRRFSSFANNGIGGKSVGGEDSGTVWRRHYLLTPKLKSFHEYLMSNHILEIHLLLLNWYWFFVLKPKLQNHDIACSFCNAICFYITC